MSEFEKYIHELAIHEEQKAKGRMQMPRDYVLVYSGVLLNWLGDFFGNPDIKWEKLTIPIDHVRFTGTSPKGNEIFIEKCQRLPSKLRDLVSQDKILEKKLRDWASFGEELILLRKDGDIYKVLDGMHRFVGCVLEGASTVEAYVPTNEKEVLPICEAHVIYDLIRGYLRNARNEESKQDLYHALRLLSKTYVNVPVLLKERFNEAHVFERDVQEVIQKVLAG